MTLLSTQQIFLDSRSTINPQDVINANIAMTSPEGSELRLYLTEFSMPQRAINMDAAFGGAGFDHIYVRTNVSSSNRESAALAGSNDPSTELFSSDILAKVPVYVGSKNVAYAASTEREAMSVIGANYVGGLSISITDHLGNNLADQFVGGTFSPNAAGFFSCTLRIDVVHVQDIHHLDVAGEGHQLPPRFVAPQIPGYGLPSDV